MWNQRYAEPGFAYGTRPNDFIGLDLAHCVEIERDIHEGKYHDGPSGVVQILGFLP